MTISWDANGRLSEVPATSPSGFSSDLYGGCHSYTWQSCRLMMATRPGPSMC